jgi:hypothetical protein
MRPGRELNRCCSLHRLHAQPMMEMVSAHRDGPGWYPDPYAAGSSRWFDGSAWTAHAVPASEPHPDQRLEQHFDPTAGDG